MSDTYDSNLDYFHDDLTNALDDKPMLVSVVNTESSGEMVRLSHHSLLERSRGCLFVICVDSFIASMI